MAMTPTEKAIELAKAKAFSLWVKNVIGEEPLLYIYDDFIEVKFTEEQQQKMIAWLDTQVGGMFQKEKAPATLKINFNDVLIPWSTRYMLPAMIGVFALGYISRSIIGTRTR